MNPNIGIHASKGGEAKQSKRVAALASRVNALPPLDSLENAMVSLEMIRNLALSGLVTGSQSGSAVRACEAWIKAKSLDVDTRRLRELERTITELEADLKKARLRVA